MGQDLVLPARVHGEDAVLLGQIAQQVHGVVQMGQAGRMVQVDRMVLAAQMGHKVRADPEGRVVVPVGQTVLAQNFLLHCLEVDPNHSEQRRINELLQEMDP